MKDYVCVIFVVQFYFKARRMQNILEYISYDFCQGEEVCLLLEHLPGDGLWFGE